MLLQSSPHRPRNIQTDHRVQHPRISISAISTALEKQGEVVVDAIIIDALLELIASISEMEIWSKFGLWSDIEFDLVKDSLVGDMALLR